MGIKDFSVFKRHLGRSQLTAIVLAGVLLGIGGTSASYAKAPIKPRVTKAPTVAGTAKSGLTLTGSKGIWTGSPTPTYTYKWYACTTWGTAKTVIPSGCTAIYGATKTTLLLTDNQLNKYIRLAVTAKNTGGSTLSVSTATAKVVSQYVLLWSNEFDGDYGLPEDVATTGREPEGASWTAEVNGNGGGNYERQYYTDGVIAYDEYGYPLKRAIQLNGQGSLIINAARALPASGDRPSTIPEATCNNVGNNCEFLSGRINTAGKVGFKYGLIEARIKIPADQGTWPAFWMLGANIGEVDWPRCGEIDIMEAASTPEKFGKAFGTLHMFPSDGFGLGSNAPAVDNLYSTYHTYGILWDSTKIQWRMDGKVYYTLTKAAATSSANAVGGQNRVWAFDQEFFLLLNLAIGGRLGGDTDGKVPQAAQGGAMAVDWVRYYSVNGVGQLIDHR